MSAERERPVMAGRPEILVLDDNAQLAATLRDTLEAEGYAVVTVGNCTDLRAALGTRPPDLLVLDVILPDGNGLDLLREIRSNAAYGRIPVIMFTSLGTHHHTQEGFERGANAFIPKPFDPNRFLAAVKRLIEEARHVPGGHL